MKKTIEINGKIYRCRDNSIEPLHFYENEDLVNCYTLVYRRRKGLVASIFLDANMYHASCGELSLVEVSPELSDKEKLIEHFNKEDAKPVLVKLLSMSSQPKLRTIFDYDEEGDAFCGSFEKHACSIYKVSLATKEECLSLYLERGVE